MQELHSKMMQLYNINIVMCTMLENNIKFLSMSK